MLHFGTICDRKPGYAKVNFAEDGFVSAWLPILMRGTQENKDCWPLNIDEEVACLMDEHHNEGVILGAVYNDADTPPDEAGNNVFVQKFNDGTIITYDTENKKLTAKITGDADIEATNITAKATTQIELQSPLIKITAPDITIEGIVSITGTLSAGGISILSTQGGDGKMESDGDIETTGTIKAGTVQQGDITLAGHVHSGVTTGAGTSGPAVQP